MGTIKKGILGSFSGKVGNVVGASWKGIAYIRSLPTSVRNPRSEKQVSHRTKFSLMGKFLKCMNPLLQIGFKHKAGKGKSAFSVAMSENLAGAVIGEYPDFAINYENVKLAEGPLYPSTNGEFTSEAGVANFTWDAKLINNAKDTDRVMGVVYNEETNEVMYDTDMAGRMDGSGTIAIPGEWSGSLMYAFLIFVREDGSMVSNSMCLGASSVI